MFPRLPLFANKRHAASCPSTERAPGDTVLGGDYRIERALGAGAAAVTYASVETATGDRVALKELALGRLRAWKQLELFEREAAVLRTLSHPGIPAYRAYREDEATGGFFLVQVRGACAHPRLQLQE